MEKKYSYYDPDCIYPLIKTRDEILKEYYPSWKLEMERAGRSNLISEELCVKDWMVENWGTEVEEDSNDKCIDCLCTVLLETQYICEGCNAALCKSCINLKEDAFIYQDITQGLCKSCYNFYLSKL